MTNSRFGITLGLAALGLAAGCGSDSRVAAPSQLAYRSSTILAVQGVAIPQDTATCGGGRVLSFSVDPPLPAGLNLDARTGALGGTPLETAPTGTYRVTARNEAGSTAADLSLTVAAPADNAQPLPNLGRTLTPLAPAGARFEPLNPGLADSPSWLASGAVTARVSPDGHTLAVLVSGFNVRWDTQTQPKAIPADCNQYVFIYDVTQPAPALKQVLPIRNTYHGLAWDPAPGLNSTVFYVSGGPDDSIHVVSSLDPATGKSTGTWVLDPAPAGGSGSQPPFQLGHVVTAPGLPSEGGNGLAVNGCTAGLALSSDGQTLVVANYANDSVTILKGGFGNWSTAAKVECDLRPGFNTVLPRQTGVPGGEYPYSVCVQGTGDAAVAFVACLRDREIDAVGLGGAPGVLARIKVQGQPNGLVMNKAQTRLYASEDLSDTVDVIDISKGAYPIQETIPVIAPPAVVALMPAHLTGANTNGLALTPDESQLWVTNGNHNCVAVVPLAGTAGTHAVTGLIPTGWYPNSVAFSADGSLAYVVNGKSPTGANPGFYYSVALPSLPTPATAHPVGLGTNLYNAQLIKAGFQTFPVPAAGQLPGLTAQTALNNQFFSNDSPQDVQAMADLHKAIKHVIFIIKENRTYDQILGDLAVGNGDPDLAEFGEAITPNHHALALGFVTLDNLMASSEVSSDGWPWTTQARCSDVVEQQWPLVYAGRGLSADSDGTNRNVNVGLPTLAERMAANPLLRAIPSSLLNADLLPGTMDVGAPDGEDGSVNKGFLWDSALRANLTVRNYGFFVDTTLYGTPGLPVNTVAAYHAPFANGIKTAVPTNVSLATLTDPYFRGFDNACPDYYRYAEWSREFHGDYAQGGLPSLSLVRLMHDHTGNFTAAQAAFLPPSAISPSDGLLTPELQVADNDYAVGLLVQDVANSPYAKDTLIFIIEDDAQDGPDHMDSHRTAAFVIGPYVKQGALVSTPYTTLNFVRTLEGALGLGPMNLNDALARPMTDLFDLDALHKGTPAPWTFKALASPLLYPPNSTLPLPPAPAGMAVMKPTHGRNYWARATRGMDFTVEDRIDFDDFNRIQWKGLMGAKPYPEKPTGKDLRADRANLLAKFHAAKAKKERKAKPRT